MPQPPHPTDLTDEQLVEAASHISFEIWMLVHTQRLYVATQSSSSPATIDDAARSNSYLESCLSHARALLEFLGARSTRKNTDVWPSDFGAPDAALDDHRLELYSKRLQLIDRHLSHLSWARVTGVLEDGTDDADEVGPDDWPVPALVAMILADLSDLVGAMKDHTAKRMLRLMIESCRAPHPPLVAGATTTNGPPITYTMPWYDYAP